MGAWLQGPVRSVGNGLLREAGGRSLDPVALAWDLRGRTAGQARLLGPGRGLIRLNRQLFEFPEGRYLELRDTVLHEMAHLVVFSRWPAQPPHGPRWRAAARALGARDRASHDLPLARARARVEYEYAVDGVRVWLGSTRHRRLQRGERCYRVRLGARSHLLEARCYTGRQRRVV